MGPSPRRWAHLHSRSRHQPDSVTTADRALTPLTLADVADAARLRCSASADDVRRAELGQFFTPSVVAQFMASLFAPRRQIRLLDPGAGVGSLTAAFVHTALAWPRPPADLAVVAFEADVRLLPALRETLEACRGACA